MSTLAVAASIYTPALAVSLAISGQVATQNSEPTPVHSPPAASAQASNDSEVSPFGIPGQTGCVYVRGSSGSICVTTQVSKSYQDTLNRWIRTNSSEGKRLINSPTSYTNGKLKSHVVGRLCEIFGGQVILKNGHQVRPERTLVRHGQTRIYDQISGKTINGVLRLYYWEGKANTAVRSADQKALDSRAIADGYPLRDYWCSINLQTAKLTNMYFDNR